MLILKCDMKTKITSLCNVWELFWRNLLRGFAWLQKKLENLLSVSSWPSQGDQPYTNTFQKTLLKAFKKFPLSTSLILTRWAVIAGSWVFWNREAQRSSWVFQLYKSKPLSLSVLFVVKTLAIEFAIINIFLVLITRKRYNITVCFPPRYLLRRLPICWRSNQEGQPPTH